MLSKREQSYNSTVLFWIGCTYAVLMLIFLSLSKQELHYNTIVLFWIMPVLGSYYAILVLIALAVGVNWTKTLTSYIYAWYILHILFIHILVTHMYCSIFLLKIKEYCFIVSSLTNLRPNFVIFLICGLSKVLLQILQTSEKIEFTKVLK